VISRILRDLASLMYHPLDCTARLDLK